MEKGIWEQMDNPNRINIPASDEEVKAFWIELCENINKPKTNPYTITVGKAGWDLAKKEKLI